MKRALGLIAGVVFVSALMAAPSIPVVGEGTALAGLRKVCRTSCRRVYTGTYCKRYRRGRCVVRARRYRRTCRRTCRWVR